MKFDMHCHTKEGSLDGKVEIEEYIRILKEKGYQGMLVSDHNSYNGYRYWRDHIKGKKYTDFVVLKGIEYDTNNAGHFLVILPEGVKPRILEMRGMPVELLTRVVHAYGGILGPAHPFGEKYLSFGSSKKYQRNPKIMQEFDFLEAYNSCEVEERNQEAKKAARKYFLAEFGGSDSHKADCIGTAYTEFREPIHTESDLIEQVNSEHRLRQAARIIMVRPKKKSARRTICCCILFGSTTKWPVLPNTTNAESSENIFRFPSVAVRDYTIRPVRKFRIENGSKHPVFDTRIFQVQLTQKLFAVLAACMSVSRTGTFGNRELIFMPESDHIRFIDKKQRTDHSQIHLI